MISRTSDSSVALEGTTTVTDSANPSADHPAGVFNVRDNALTYRCTLSGSALANVKDTSPVHCGYVTNNFTTYTTVDCVTWT